MKRFKLRMVFYAIILILLVTIVRIFSFEHATTTIVPYMIFPSILLLLPFYGVEHLLKKLGYITNYKKKDIWIITYSLVLVTCYYIVRIIFVEKEFISFHDTEFHFFIFCLVLSVFTLILSFIINFIFLNYDNK